MGSHEKPSGSIGATWLFKKGSHAEDVQFPKRKRDLEHMILERALPGIVREGIWDSLVMVSPNPEDHLDYTLEFVGGSEAYLDLMEIAPLEEVRGSYEAAPDHRAVDKFVDFIMKKIVEKNRAYAGIRDTPKHLLLYSTDLRFQLGTSDIGLVRLILSRSEHGFATIPYYCPFGNRGVHGRTTMLFPVDGSKLPERNEASLRRRVVFIGSPVALKASEEPSAVFSFSDFGKNVTIDSVSYVIGKDVGERGLAGMVYGAPMLEGTLTTEADRGIG